MSALAGKCVVVTRAASQAEVVEKELLARKARPLLYPCIDFAEPRDLAAFDQSIFDLYHDVYDWLVVTSPTAADALAQRFGQLLASMRDAGTCKIAVVGAATAAAIQRNFGRECALIPDRATGEALGKAIPVGPGTKVLLPLSDASDGTLADTLRDRGAEVTVVTAYRNVLGTGGDDLPAHLAAGAVDAITLTSGSTARNLKLRLEAEGGSWERATTLPVACIGPSTSKIAEELGLNVVAVPEKQSIEAMVAELERYFAGLKEQTSAR
jgi:uroporphyrinogen-III synthase